MRDNENADDDDRNNACWAQSVEIVDFTVVNGSAGSIGAFVVYIIKVQTLGVSHFAHNAISPFGAYNRKGSYMHIRKRYSEFHDFRERLILSFPTFEAMIPQLPPKSVISKFRPKFLEKRRAGLQYFLQYV